MLKRIIKRNGTFEAFTPHKVNMWSQWASDKLGNRVDWSRIVLETIKQLGEEAHSQDLQRQLIKTCISKKSWPYNLMAGKLYIAIYRKEIYGNEIPTVMNLHSKMLKYGLIREMKFTPEDYEYIERVIDHTRDFDLAHFQIHQIRKKYSLQDRITSQEFETPQFVFMRMAMALAEDEPRETRLEHLRNWYNHFSFNRINAPTPNYVNLGTPHNGYASCCLYTVDDNAQSLAIGDHIAYTMTYMSAGIGGFINTRSLGDSVRSGSIVHQGRLLPL
jgi:ribonucleoside-diphosphate reductase alpha chain